MGVVTTPSNSSISTESAFPGICKELIGQSLARLRGCSVTEDSMADRLASDLQLVYMAIQTISDLYDSLDDDSQENGEIPWKIQHFMKWGEEQCHGDSNW